MPKNLIARADKRAAELGMSRSSFFGFALNVVLGSIAVPAGAQQKVEALARSLKARLLAKPKDR